MLQEMSVNGVTLDNTISEIFEDITSRKSLIISIKQNLEQLEQIIQRRAPQNQACNARA